jgi:Na+-translocating ferredoxin:NAD+ oxidoreductase RnfD subunit
MAEEELVKQPTSQTTRKVQAATIGAALTSLLVALTVYFVPAWSDTVSTEALVLLLTPIVTPLVTWLFGYYTLARKTDNE